MNDIDYAHLEALKTVGIIQQKQKEYFAMRLHAVGGDFTASQIMAAAEVATKYGRGQLHLSTRQGIEIHFVHYANLDKARQHLEAAGLIMGACGPRVRVITACPGAMTCSWGIIDTKRIARDLDRRYFRRETPYKFKIAIAGCPHNCTKVMANDIGIMGGIEPFWDKKKCTGCELCVNVCPTGAIVKTHDDYILDELRCIHCSICTSGCPADAWKVGRRGYILWLGGTMGRIPRPATRMPGLIETRKRLDKLIMQSIAYYRRHGRKKERFGHMMDRIGVEAVVEEILHGK